MTEPNELQSAIALFSPGDAVPVEIWRGGRSIDFTVILKGRDDPGYASWLTELNQGQQQFVEPQFEEDRGWADLAVVPSTIKSQGVWNWETSSFDAVQNVSVPIVGFAAWERTFSEDADRNYGRIVEHSFTVESTPPLVPPT